MIKIRRQNKTSFWVGATCPVPLSSKPEEKKKQLVFTFFSWTSMSSFIVINGRRRRSKITLFSWISMSSPSCTLSMAIPLPLPSWAVDRANRIGPKTNQTWIEVNQSKLTANNPTCLLNSRFFGYYAQCGNNWSKKNKNLYHPCCSWGLLSDV